MVKHPPLTDINDSAHDMALLQQNIGRYSIIKELGRGGQGVVWLAKDAALSREVAIKQLNKVSAEAHERLMQEARLVSQLRHSNIVTLYDLVEQGSQMSLVFEFVAGEGVDKILRQGPLAIPQAVAIARQVLDGLQYAHTKGVIHRDIKPANIILDSNGNARITDFGLATRVEDKTRALAGSGSFVAPEYVRGEAGGVNADVFSLGALLYTLLTGEPPVKGDSIYEIMYKLAHGNFEAPSKKNAAVDQKLDDIVLKAMFRQQGDRFASAKDMNDALQQWQQGETAQLAPSSGTASAQSTLDFLMRRMRHTRDFPALSASISSINKIAASDVESLQKLSTAILKDFALTNKLLKIVNAAGFGQFQGRISTISRAVMILGFNTIRNLAITLMLVEHMQNPTQASLMRDEVMSSFLTAMIGKRLAVKTNLKDPEEAFICCMFHNLGRMLSTFYFHEETLEIRKRCQQGAEEGAASSQVLGVTYSALGAAVAKNWNLPPKIVQSMRRNDDDDRVAAPRNEEDRLTVISNMANDLFHVLSSSVTPPPGQVEQLQSRYRDALPLGIKPLNELLEGSAQDLLRESAFFGIQGGRSELVRHLRQVVSNKDSKPETAAAAVKEGSKNASDVASSDLVLDVPISVETMNTESALTAGIQDITNTLVDRFNLNDLFRMVLETMYRGMQFDRVLLFLRDLSNPRLIARFAFGQQTEGFIGQLTIPINRNEDAFQLALSKGTDIFIENAHAESIKAHIPAWYWQQINGESFLLLPLLIDRKLIGLLYADKRHVGQLTINTRELNLLKTLRTQLLLGIRQKQMGAL